MRLLNFSSNHSSIFQSLHRVVLPILALALLLFFYRFQTRPLDSWLIDDAGISFAYARNLAEGHGLVAQPGAPRVEGFSNPAWVFLLSLFSAFRIDILVVVKPLSIFLTALGLLLFYLATYKFFRSHLLAFVSTLWLSGQPPLVIWSVSGLESSLLFLEVVSLFYLVLQKPNLLWALLSGLIAGITALTRPEAFVYLLVYPALYPRYSKPSLFPGLVLWGGYLLFRLFYFGSWLPNTFFMKAEKKILTLPWLIGIWGRFKTLILGLLGPKYVAIILIVVLASLLAVLVWKRKITKPFKALFLLLTISSATYLLLPSDWMGECRFGIPVLPFFAIFVIAIVSEALQLSLPNIKDTRVVTALASILLILVFAFLYKVTYLPRLERFYANPTVNFYGVKADFYRFVQYANVLGLSHPSVLLPDVGGALYGYPEAQIVDLGGLVDATIASTLDKNQPEFYDYVFEVVKPDFIHVHGGWTYAARLDDDPRFRRDYLPIYEYIDDKMAKQFGEERWAGDFVRRELVTPATLESLQNFWNP